MRYKGAQGNTDCQNSNIEYKDVSKNTRRMTYEKDNLLFSSGLNDSEKAVGDVA